jgi:hypothetical protein
MSKIERILYVSFGGIVWVYLGLRAANIPLIHDEAVTFFTYIQSANFVPPWAYWDANNHFVNSAFGTFFHLLLGTSPFIVRFASWISFLPLLFFVFGIAQNLKSKIARWIWIIPIITTPFFIEFFSLTRGYGMAMSWLIGLIYFTLKYSNPKKNTDLLIISGVGLLATLSSLSVIVVVLIIYGWLLLVQLKELKNPVLPTFIKWFSIFILPQLPLVYYGLLLKEKGLLYYGGPNFIEITLKSLSLFLLNSKAKR